MSTMNVLYMPVTVSPKSLIELVKDLLSVVDEPSLIVLDQLIHSTVCEEPHQEILGIGALEIEKNVPFPQISHLLEKEGFEGLSVINCLHLLTHLKGEENTDMRRTFFEGGLTLLSTSPIIINGKLNYLIVGQDQCHKKHDQRPFSIRLLTPPKIFLHSLYRVIAAKV